MLKLAFLLLAVNASGQIGAINTFPGGTTGQLEYNNGGRFGGMAGSTVTGQGLALSGSMTATSFIGPVAAAGVDLSTVTTALGLKVDKNTPDHVNLSTVTTALGLKADKGNTEHIDLSTVTTALATKQATGNYITGLTGAVTASGPGSAAATIVGPVPANGVDLSTVTTALALKAPLASPTFTGTVTAPDLSVSGLISGAGAMRLDGAAGVRASSFTATYGLTAATGSFSGSVTASSVTANGSLLSNGGANGGQVISNSASGITQYKWQRGGTSKWSINNNVTGTDFFNIQNEGLGTSAISLDFTNNNLGIGTTGDPATKIHMSSGTLTIDGDTPSGFPLNVTNGGGNSNRGTQAKFGSDTYVSNFGGATYLTALSELSNSGVWTARGTTAAGIGVNDTNGIVFNINSGLVSGNTFSPTARATLTTTGLGIGVAAPATALEVNGGARLNTVTAQPACAVGIRGTFWATQGAAGVKDTVQVCAKDAADAYAWRVIY